ncbi:phenylacetate-CoA oxygenase/reductase subunit PaaK [Rhodococcus rhodnii]|uniref:Phenylacetic acid degradation ring hydroxlyating n=2 Tax=Rhodococcus rhodnii TaxID=38312 RepID=R7WLH8_9NOCA|nr:1,2-phenylacetyl-CoA epoxidase subunit PaaE [Rhodococcus rhodnii]EOM76176.1 phenylacetic acid degradation ring hydroxlyating [Rhodococcus rhodnii LMG 5362]TXG91817.1 phenylacetate-CoA oxygenase/reductase subunit PaaK [Rhodococcus rhodnii]
MTTVEKTRTRQLSREFHTLTVADVEQLCDDAVAVTFDVPAELTADFEFLPGQSLTLRRTVDGVEHRRTYSICSPVGAPPRVGVRQVPGGVLSTWLVEELRTGDTVDAAPPGGTFAADPTASGVHLLVAAGSGITPILSIAGSLLAESDSTVILLYGNRRTRSVMFAEEIADLKDRYGTRFEVIHVLSREPRDVELFSGRLDADRLRDILHAVVPVSSIDDVWLCGPFGMISDAKKVLGAAGVATSAIHHELFYVEDTAPIRDIVREPGTEGPVSEITIVLDGRTTTDPLPRDQAVLDSAESVRSDLPFACKGGVCGTCRAKVTAGTVDMLRNFALEDDEVADGFVLTCQTLPTSDAVTIDFDA